MLSKDHNLSHINDPNKFWLKLIPPQILSKISNYNGLLAAINNSGWLIFDKLIRLALGFIVSAWIARYLGPSDFGILAYVLAYLAFFQTISVLGMDGIIVRDIARDKDKAGEVLGTAFILRLTVGFICWIFAIIGMIIFNGIHDEVVYITAITGGLLLFQSVDTVDLWFQSQSESRRTVIAKLTAYLLSSSVKIILILNEAPLIAFATIMLFETVVAAVALVIAYRKYPCYQSWVFLKQRAYKIINESWPFILSGLSISIYMRIDQIMIKEFMGDSELGIYAAVLPFATLWSFIPMTLSISLAPFVAKTKQKGEREYWTCLYTIFRVFAIIAWFVAIPISLMSNHIVSILLGAKYEAGSVVLSIMAFVNIFINMGIAQSLWILNEGKSKVSLYKTMIGAVVCVAANLILIPKYGLIGASVSALLAQFTSCILSNFLICKKIFYLQVRSLFFIKMKF